ncbi:MAG: substrate-binding domain-containing protein [Eubacteriales bacterium]|nr:substrate-binding domain-containing protein [Eubacteriales bacterium]
MCFGCGKKKAEEETPVKQEEKMQIGLSFDSFVIERWTRDRDMFVSTAQSLGAEVNVQVAGGDVKEQISQIEYFIKKKMDAIAIIAIDGEALTEVVKKAQDAGIKIICYDRLIQNAGADLYISFDNEMVGELMGRTLVQECPEGGNIFMINGSPSDHNVKQVDEGFMRAIEGSGLKVVYTNFCENWLAELAFDKMNEGLGQTKDIVGIMCGNDDLASQAIRSLSENRMAGKVAVVAQDADLSACQRIVEGTQTMTVYKSVEELAQKAAELSVALVKGEELPQTADEYRTIYDGTYTVPCYFINPVAVTAENLDEVIIKSGFHQAEDVYLNIK